MTSALKGKLQGGVCLIVIGTEGPTGGRKPINAKSETVARLPTFRDAYQKRRCILPVDGFYEWRATKQGKQPYAIALKDRSPFGIAALWENWEDPATREWVRTFVVLTTPSNDLVSRLCQSNGRSSARGATRPPSSDIQAARARHSANVAERLCL